MRTDHFASQFMKIKNNGSNEGYLDIYSCDVSFLKDETNFNDVYNTMPRFRKEKADSFKSEKDKLLSIGAWALLKSAAHKRGLSNFEERLELNEDGKPCIKGINVYFNLSHSGKYAMCVLSSSPVGCDIEKISDDNKKALESVMHESEVEICQKNGATLKGVTNDKTIALTRLWTLKESLLKMLGTGLAIDPKNICFTEIFKQKSIYALECKETEGKKIMFKEINIAPDYCASVCVLLESK